MTTRVKHVTGPGSYNHSSFNGVSHRGDEHTVSDAAAEYLCDRVGYFERTDDVVLSEDEYSVEDGTGDETPALDDKTYDELRDLASEAEIDGRGSMNKDELVDALRDQE